MESTNIFHKANDLIMQIDMGIQKSKINSHLNIPTELVKGIAEPNMIP